MNVPNDIGRHCQINTQARFLTIPGITRSSTFDTTSLSPLQGINAIYVDDTLNTGAVAFLGFFSPVVACYKTHQPERDSI